MFHFYVVLGKYRKIKQTCFFAIEQIRIYIKNYIYTIFYGYFILLFSPFLIYVNF